ncbi:hypothetical protein QFZ32_004914 [Streptomyces canus]|uniref:Uncharacterized protein n=1 Tax=Streptomyces canus TaxID=58343 RepID=A0AAW8FI42_9ACTN|nr:hypothetical protein [Streptomyces canus]MDQ0909459.1 hypothetical protein [Streptomyces canus]MDQ1069474.1 hypothetical protein [Streptomyces canus]
MQEPGTCGPSRLTLREVYARIGTYVPVGETSGEADTLSEDETPKRASGQTPVRDMAHIQFAERRSLMPRQRSTSRP